MKHLIEIKESSWVEIGKKVRSVDKNGKIYYGPPISHGAGDIILVEAGEEQADGSFTIIRVVDRSKRMRAKSNPGKVRSGGSGVSLLLLFMRIPHS